MRARTDLTERQEIALDFLAIVEGCSRAEMRRRAVAAYADQLLTDPLIAGAVRNCLSYRREHGVGGRQVTVLRSIR